MTSGRGVLVERKTVVDFQLTRQRGRLWTQIGRLRNAARIPYVLVEGCDLDANALSPSATKGAYLAVLGQGVPLLRSSGPTDSVLWLRLLAERAHGVRLGRDRPAYAQRLKSPRAQTSEAMLAAVPGISVAGARALLEHFGSVSAVITAREDELLRVPGIGPRRAAALRAAIS
jgi:Fanconi anemia group M protein